MSGEGCIARDVQVLSVSSDKKTGDIEGETLRRESKEMVSPQIEEKVSLREKREMLAVFSGVFTILP